MVHLHHNHFEETNTKYAHSDCFFLPFKKSKNEEAQVENISSPSFLNFWTSGFGPLHLKSVCNWECQIFFFLVLIFFNKKL